MAFLADIQKRNTDVESEPVEERRIGDIRVKDYKKINQLSPEERSNVLKLSSDYENFNKARDSNMIFKLAMKPTFTTTYSRFETYFKKEEKQTASEWTKNQILMRFLFMINIERKDSIINLKAIENFCKIYQAAEKKETDEDMLHIAYTILSQSTKDGIVTKKQFEEKLSLTLVEENEFIGKEQYKNPIIFFMHHFIKAIPEKFDDEKHFIQIFQLVYHQIIQTNGGIPCYNPDAICMFQQIDVDRSWKISKDEFINYYTSNNPILKKNKELAELMFIIIDTDNSGEVEINEFTVFAKEYQSNDGSTLYGLLKCIFYMMDKDHSNTLEDSELRPILMRFFKTDNEKDYDNFVKEIDRNHDGVVTFWEFLRMFEVEYQ